MSYHHFESIKDTTRVLAHFLKPGGTLLVADIMEVTDPAQFPVIPEKFQHLVSHHSGISEAKMRDAFESAGLEGFGYVKATSALAPGRGNTPVDFFLAYATKPKVEGQ